MLAAFYSNDSASGAHEAYTPQSQDIIGIHALLSILPSQQLCLAKSYAVPGAMHYLVISLLRSYASIGVMVSQQGGREGREGGHIRGIYFPSLDLWIRKRKRRRNYR